MAPPPKRATIRQLAAHTGLSPAAVSYALRGLHVSAETQQRVREAAEAIGYEADPIARALRGGQTALVGVLCASMDDLWHQSLVRAFGRELRRVDRHVLVADADGDPEREAVLARRLVDQRVDALIVSPLDPTSAVWGAVAARVPLVSISDALPGVERASAVVFDNAGGVGAVMQHLAERGHERIAAFAPSRASTPDRPSEQVVAVWARRLGLDCRIVNSPHSLDGAADLARDVLASEPRPTACFCLSDSIAHGVYAACRAVGLATPGDVAIAGYDDHPISELLTPPLTSVDWDTDHVAATAVRFMLETLAGGDGGHREVVPPRLRVRAST